MESWCSILQTRISGKFDQMESSHHIQPISNPVWHLLLPSDELHHEFRELGSRGGGGGGGEESMIIWRNFTSIWANFSPENSLQGIKLRSRLKSQELSTQNHCHFLHVIYNPAKTKLLTRMKIIINITCTLSRVWARPCHCTNPVLQFRLSLRKMTKGTIWPLQNSKGREEIQKSQAENIQNVEGILSNV